MLTFTPSVSLPIGGPSTFVCSSPSFAAATVLTMNNGHGVATNLGYGVMGPPHFATMSHQDVQDHNPYLDSANNSAIAHGVNLDLEEESIDADKGSYMQHNDRYDMGGRPGPREAIQKFVMPEGFVADYVPSWSKNRSIIFDFGVKATNTQTGKTVWFCLASPQCEMKSAKGVGIAIKGAVTNCTNHLRDLHKVISPRSAKIVRRKPEPVENSDGEAPTGSSAYKKRMLASSRAAAAAAAVLYDGSLSHQAQQHLSLMHHPSGNLYANMALGGANPGPMNGSSSSANLNAASAAAVEAWQQHFARNGEKKYQVIAAPGMESMALTIAAMHPTRFMYHKTQWGKFPDGTDNIMIGGFQPVNRIAGENVLMLASFANNSTTLTQLLVMVTLLQSFIESLTVVLPFYPVGTMERISREGQVATASTYAQMLSNLPNCGRPTRLVIYDLHTLQNRFYLHGHAFASMQTAIPLLIERIRSTHINCIAYPDDGAYKRFGHMLNNLGFEIVTCGKTSDGDKRIVNIQDGRPYGKHVLVIDDLAQTGATMYQCGMACKSAGAASVSAFLVHAVFPNHSWRSFLPDGAHYGCFERFFVTNSVPSVTDVLPANSVFEVLDLSGKIVEDLDRFS